jgi:hypothetical protein
VMTFSALAMEFSLAFFLWFRACRPFVIYLGFMLHAGILITINIPCFGELMWIGYLAFLTPPEFDAMLHAVDVRRLFRKKKADLETQVEAEAEIEVSEFHEPVPAFRPTSVIVRFDAGGDFARPHRIDAAASRDFEKVASRDSG